MAEPDDNQTDKSQLRRIVAMLTKLVARNNSVSETPSVYFTSSEHEHRYAEHEQERKPRVYGVALTRILDDNEAYTLTKTGEHGSLDRLREWLNALEDP